MGLREGFVGGALDLVAGHVADVLGEAPSVAERVGDLGVALTGEPVGRGSGQLGARCDGACDEGVDVVGGEIEDR